MNFLAHIYLSGENPKIKLGNFIADSYKGSSYKTLQPEIAFGIEIHRFIDSFADSHEQYSIGKKRLSEQYGHYSGIVIDVFYDHFLAKYWKEFSDKNFDAYCRHFYLLLATHANILPPRYRFMMPFMITNNWLKSYVEIDKVTSVLSRMSRRTSLPDYSEFAKKVLVENYEQYKSEFFEFMPLIILKVEDKFKLKIR